MPNKLHTGDRFTPIPSSEGGFQTAALSGTQRLSDLFSFPELPYCAWLQADADIGFRMDSDTGSSGVLTLPALTFLPLSNVDMLNACILVGTAQVAIQFGTGTVGPIPPQPIIETGGGPTPPPPSGLTSLPTQNVVHVMKNGNDSTGLRNRLDKPFLTPGAAQGVAQPGDTIVIWPGTYNSQLLTVNVNYMLIGATITGSGAAAFTFSGSDSVTIFGSGRISNSFGSLNIVANADATGTFISRGIDYGGSPTLSGTAGNAFTVDIEGDMLMLNASWSMTVGGISKLRTKGNISAPVAGTTGVFHQNGEWIHYGDIQTTKRALTSGAGSVVTIYGNVSAIAVDADNQVSTISCNGGGRVTVYGDVIGVNGEFDGDMFVLATGLNSSINVVGDVIYAGMHGIATIGTGGGTTRVEGNVRFRNASGDSATSLIAIHNRTGGAFDVTVYGDVFGASQAIVLSSANPVYQVRCRVTGDVNGFTINNAVVELASDTQCLIEGRLMASETDRKLIISTGKLSVLGGMQGQSVEGGDNGLVIGGTWLFANGRAAFSGAPTNAKTMLLPNAVLVAQDNTSVDLLSGTLLSLGAWGRTSLANGLVLGSFNVESNIPVL